MNQSRELLKALSFCVIDLETTGGNQENDQIIEVGMVNIDQLKISESKNILINPEKTIPEFIQKLTSIKQEDVENCPTIDEVIDEVINFIGNRIIVAHNTSFDVPFLNSVLRRLDRDELNNKVICTNVMTKHMIPEIMTSNLTYMSQLFNIEHENAHRAMDDAVASAKLLLKYLEIFEKKGIKKVNQLYYPRNKFELDRINFQKDTSSDEIIKIIAEHNTPIQITLKGNRGLILAVLPIESSKKEKDFIKSVIDKIDWEIVSVSLQSPLLESFLQLNNHLQKFPEDVKDLIISYLLDRYSIDNTDSDFKLQNLDFVSGHHLVNNQICVFSFINLNTTKKNLFKFPSHKKKMIHFLSQQVKVFEKNLKGKKKIPLTKEIVSIIEGHLHKEEKNKTYCYLSVADIKNPQKTIRKIEKFVTKRNDKYNFPNKHF